MRNDTRLVFNQYMDRQAQLNGVDRDVVRSGHAFTIAPSIQQTLEQRQQESSAFLRSINVVGVDELEGEKLGLGVTGPIASRTNTATTDRAPIDYSVMDQRGFKCSKTDSDTKIGYGKLDLWAKFPNFQVMLRDSVINQQALDRIMIGWNGTSIAATTNKGTSPLLQDVNKGWLQYMREVAASHVVTEGGTDGEIRIGAAAGRDYYNMDALVKDMIHTILPSWARVHPDLVVVLGADLLHDKYFPMINVSQAPTEQLAADIITSKQQVGGRPAVTVPFFPADAIMVTPLKNLSLYYQNGKRRRTIVDNAKRDQIETYESSNDGYVVEDPEFAFVLENIALEWT